MSTNGRDREDGDSLPPSCRCVLLAFEKRDTDTLTRQELLEETELPTSTLDDALRTLENRHSLLLARKSDSPDRVVAEIQDPRDV
jgi:hypothetical protein